MITETILNTKKKQIKVIDTRNLEEIRQALIKTLYVPDKKLKPRIIEEILDYLKLKFSIPTYKIKVFLAYSRSKIIGYVCTEINPLYKSRNRKSATFGWVFADTFEACKVLMRSCEEFARKYNVKLIRGNINFPKSLGGIGIQESGFEQPMLYGVPFNNPNSKIKEFLERLGYKRDAQYVCMEVTQSEWNKGKNLDEGICIRYLSLNELRRKKEDILAMANDLFYTVLPDAIGIQRLEQMLDIYSQIPISHFKLPDNFNPKDFSTQPEFLEAWKSCDLEQVNTFVPLAFDRKTDQLVGVIFSLPDLYELWLEKPITRANVDTVMVRSNYGGKGIFSALNNIGRLTVSMNGVNYAEGTGIWMVNEDAIRTVLPHGNINRRFIVYQKRLKK